MSRLAKSSPIMWRDVFKHNKHNLLEAINHFEKEMLYAKNLVQEDEWDALIEWMKKANTLHTFL